MEKFSVFSLNEGYGYAISLPLSGLSDPDFAKVVTLFERLVDWAGLRAYHKNPGDFDLTEQQQLDVLNKYFYYEETSRLFLALFFMSQSDDVYHRLLKFAEITRDTFKKNNL